MKHPAWPASALLFLATTATPALADIPPPALLFDFDEESGTLAVNGGSLGEGSDGTINGAIRSDDSAFSTGTSLTFDGDTDFVSVPDTFDYGDKLTMEAWIKPSSVAGQRIIWDDYGNPGVLFAVFDGELEWNVSTASNPGQGVAVFDGVVCPGLWQHVAGIYDGAAIRAYVNGEQVGEPIATSGNIIDNASNPAHIGADFPSSSELEFAGEIDGLRVYLAALTQDELGSGAPMLVCGELTGDCAITTTDALSALRMAVGLIAADPAADMNFNAGVTSNDALAILRVAVGSLLQSNRCNGL